MRAKTDQKPRNAAPHPGPADVDGLRGAMAVLLLEATRFIASARVEELARGWLARADAGQADPGREVRLVADALGMATDLALFTPSTSGATAFDRLARARAPSQPDEAGALEALRRAQFRLLRVERVDGDGSAQLRDLASGAVLQVLDESIPAAAVGVALAGRLAPLGDDQHVFAGGVTPLDEAGLTVAMGFVRASAGRGLINPLRCAEAVYRHVLRHGTPEIPGLNRPPEGEDDPLEEGGEFDQLALRWAEPDVVHDPADIQPRRLSRAAPSRRRSRPQRRLRSCSTATACR